MVTDADDQTLDLTIPERITLARKRAHLEQTHVAEALGVSRAQVSRWENGRGLPDVAEGARLAQLLGVSFGWLFGVPVRSRCFAPDDPLTVASLSVV